MSARVQSKAVVSLCASWLQETFSCLGLGSISVSFSRVEHFPLSSQNCGILKAAALNSLSYGTLTSILGRRAACLSSQSPLLPGSAVVPSAPSEEGLEDPVCAYLFL